MHDGQNLFDAYTSYVGEWEVDETLNSLYNRGFDVPIVVGINHGNDLRIDELTPYVNEEWGGGEGDEYMAFIVETLKPYIDANYRTLPDRENTGIIGSSLGGLISVYGALKYQEVFSKAGSFSPAYWINYDSLWPFVDSTGYEQDIRFYQNMGSLEGEYAIGLMHSMETSLLNNGFENITSKVISGADHNEETWKNDFEPAYLWLFSEYADIEEAGIDAVSMYIYPNPATNKIDILNSELSNGDMISILNCSGQTVMRSVCSDERSKFDISSLAPGIYVAKIQTEGSLYTLKFVKQ
jgi:predicted alpha/beta superfamily hydrolase